MPFHTTERRIYPRHKVNGISVVPRPPSSTSSSPTSSQESGDWNFADDRSFSDSTDPILRDDDPWLRSRSGYKPQETVTTLPRPSVPPPSTILPFHWDIDLANAARRTQRDLDAAHRFQEYKKFKTFPPNTRNVFETTRSSREFERFLPTDSPSFPAVELLKETDFESILRRARENHLGEQQAPSNSPDVPASDATQKKKRKKKPKKKKSSINMDEKAKEVCEDKTPRIDATVVDHTDASATSVAAAAAEPTLVAPQTAENNSVKRKPSFPSHARKSSFSDVRRSSVSSKGSTTCSPTPAPKTMEGAAPLAQADLGSDIHSLTISPMVPSALYGPLLEEVMSLGYELEGISRRSEYFGNLERTYKQGLRRPMGTDDWRQDLKSVTNFSFLLQLSKKPGGVPLSAARCLESLRAFLMRAVQSPGLTAAEREGLTNLTADDLFHVSREVRTKNAAASPDTTERRLPPREKAELRISRAEVFYSDPELPQAVFIAARMSFATPIMKKLLEATNRFELLGLKYLKDLSVDHAKYLTPYEVGDVKWHPSLEKITQKGQDGQGWVMMVVRKSNGFERVEEIVGSYLKSYLSISDSVDTEGPKLGRRRRGVSQKATDVPSINEPELFDPLEALRLNVLVSPNVEACYNQITIFFRDSELVPGGTQTWEDRQYHPQWYLHDPYIGKTLLEHAPFLTTICVVKASLFPHLGRIINRMRKEDFDIAGLKVTRMNYHTARKMLAHDEDAIRHGPEVLDRFYHELTEGPVAVFMLQRTNAVKRWLDVMSDIRKNSKTPSSESLFQGGIFASTSHRLAHAHRIALFPEGPTLRLRYWRGRDRFEKSLHPTDLITETPRYPRTLTSNRRRDSYFMEQIREPTLATSASSRSSMASPPPTPVSEMEQKDPPELVCVTLLPAHLKTDDTYRSWGAILDALLLESKKGADGSEDGFGDVASDSGSAKPGGGNEQERQKRSGGKKRRKQKKEKEMVAVLEESDGMMEPRPSSPDIPAPRLVACRYVVCGESAITEWQKFCPQWDPNVASSEVASWSERLKTEQGTTVITDDAPPWKLMQRGACLAVALEADRCAERVQAIIDRLPEYHRRCVTYTTTCDEACGQLPIFFGELFDSFYRIALERKPSVSEGVMG
ncbi:uncharacterized protein SPPG_07691 [Spizellomyces punctatus DAOM BR117]|uniref:Nucleoside diphosphate kinase n=1 Tax=Spizellomyces punctatus (strain DAOM BR117) TaxID=645134 RepID=A0A0L0H7B4_SPIPD|nr:uncharacterized protein SPPG_07691 [Spizellomyces punctatus DAOM BR117]KNC96859.1 hypothetical protein SPPG_07691 [Spizellomyces punctatus DAOM BR117]|eukprot:XP_016604899.1 hypothetical protein SPPG_07691 [Spizellomyces punctatus DAOM BR117]